MAWMSEQQTPLQDVHATRESLEVRLQALEARVVQLEKQGHALEVRQTNLEAQLEQVNRDLVSNARSIRNGALAGSKSYTHADAIIKRRRDRQEPLGAFYDNHRRQRDGLYMQWPKW